jgi:hypothetical protein
MSNRNKKGNPQMKKLETQPIEHDTKSEDRIIRGGCGAGKQPNEADRGILRVSTAMIPTNPTSIPANPRTPRPH